MWKSWIDRFRIPVNKTSTWGMGWQSTVICMKLYKRYRHICKNRKYGFIFLNISIFTISNFRNSYKGYTVSYRDSEPLKGESISSPFYGHGIYSYRPEGSIYLPGRISHTGGKNDEVNTANFKTQFCHWGHDAKTQVANT